MRLDKVAKVDISASALLSLLKLPRDIKVLAVQQTPDQVPAGDFTLVVAHDSLQHVPPGGAIPWGRITLFNEFCQACEQSHLVRGELTNG